MGSLTASLALGDSGDGVLIIGIVVIVLVILCAAFGLNAWFRVRRIDGATTADTPEPAAPRTPEPAPPAEDLPEDPDYQGPGDWDGGPADPPEFRTPPA
jgi:hypothetical protein